MIAQLDSSRLEIVTPTRRVAAPGTIHGLSFSRIFSHESGIGSGATKGKGRAVGPGMDGTGGGRLCVPGKNLDHRFRGPKLFESLVCMAARAVVAQSGRAPDC